MMCGASRIWLVNKSVLAGWRRRADFAHQLGVQRPRTELCHYAAPGRRSAKSDRAGRPIGAHRQLFSGFDANSVLAQDWRNAPRRWAIT